MDAFSVLVLASGRHTESLAGIKAIVRSLNDQRGAVPAKVQLVIIDLTGNYVDGDFDDFQQARLLSCAGLRTGAARNLAIRQARGKLICFIDADCVPGDCWLASLTAPFMDEDIAGVMGTYSFTSSNLVSRFSQLEREARYRRLGDSSAIDFVDMYSAAYRRSVLLANGGFDERFDSLEEQELSYRLAGRGYRMVFRNEAQVLSAHPTRLAGYLVNKARTGYWKAQVIRLFPDRGLSDSYTPQAVKLQMGAIFAAGLALLLSLAQPWLLVGVAVALLLFLVSSVPFLALTWQLDRQAVLIAVPLLFARAIVLGAGYFWGIVRPPPSLARRTSRIAGTTYLVKRFIDITGSLIGLAVTAVLAPFLAILIKLSTPGPVLFRQTRVGRGGRPFVLLKFRTMEVDAEDRLAELIDLSELEQPAFKLVNDPRVTRVGRFLRRWSLDEMPQFWNVLRGEMSLVGPRPEEKRIVALYSDWHRKRLAVKPGMTGPMQVHGRGDLPLDERVELEIAYIEEYTLWQDMKILASTIPSVLRGEGAR